MSRSSALMILQQEYASCQHCPELVANRSQVVFGVGNPDKCKVVIIGEAPGKREDLNGEPFVGRSGQVLNELLDSIGLKREEVYITNTVLCRPPDNRNPTTEELKNCRQRLNNHINILDPGVVITLGNFSTKYMLDTKQGITQLRGKPHHINGTTIIPMFHPAVLLYSGNSPQKRKIMEDDFKIVQTIIGTKKEQEDLDEF